MKLVKHKTHAIGIKFIFTILIKCNMGSKSYVTSEKKYKRQLKMHWFKKYNTCEWWIQWTGNEGQQSWWYREIEEFEAQILATCVSLRTFKWPRVLLSINNSYTRQLCVLHSEQKKKNHHLFYSSLHSRASCFVFGPCIYTVKQMFFKDPPWWNPKRSLIYAAKKRFLKELWGSWVLCGTLKWTRSKESIWYTGSSENV